MSLRRVANVVALLQIFVALSMLMAAGVAFLYGEGDFRGILFASIITFFANGLIYRVTMFEGDLTSRDGFAIVTMAWTATAAFGALPYLMTGALASPMAAFFEAMSGFTTTGASVFTDIEALPHGVLFWRSLTHWLGGMGIIVLVIAVLPFLGVGGMQLFKAEVPGLTPERLRPRITQTAKLLWLVYLGLTAAETVLYMFGGMSLFDAVNHSFATLATGGFSTKNASIASFDSAYIHWVTIVFMYLAGVNFSLHFRAAMGRPLYFKDQEWRFFTYVVVLSGLAIAVLNLTSGSYSAFEPALRDALFQATSIVTTTGFVSADYELWVPGSQMILFALFFVGGMAGSTGGGIKTIRVMLLLKQTANEIRRHLHPKAVLLTRVGTKAVKQEVLANVTGFVILYLLLCLAGAVVLGFMGLDLPTALGASISSVGNVGPAFGAVGPTDNYGWMSGPALGLLSFFMLVGRLEIFTVLLLFHPETWRARRSFH
ncbi:MAG: TrkH family potassium uptake protein [Gemmatimonadetes bacterium]|jgi:trk system potassium uptake protein|nr:TrkH family potassium uptake protein [Gemmatimonadota bacterium]